MPQVSAEEENGEEENGEEENGEEDTGIVALLFCLWYTKRFWHGIDPVSGYIWDTEMALVFSMRLT